MGFGVDRVVDRADLSSQKTMLKLVAWALPKAHAPLLKPRQKPPLSLGSVVNTALLSC